MDKVNLVRKFSLFSELWTPKVVGELNDNFVKLGKIKGEFVWHRHDNEDEMFLVVKGQMTIKLRDRDIPLAEGEFFIVPKGVEHMPVAEKETWIMMVEPKTTLNTGDRQNERTVAEPEWI